MIRDWMVPKSSWHQISPGQNVSNDNKSGPYKSLFLASKLHFCTKLHNQNGRFTFKSSKPTKQKGWLKKKSPSTHHPFTHTQKNKFDLSCGRKQMSASAKMKYPQPPLSRPAWGAPFYPGWGAPEWRLYADRGTMGGARQRDHLCRRQKHFTPVLPGRGPSSLKLFWGSIMSGHWLGVAVVVWMYRWDRAYYGTTGFRL